MESKTEIAIGGSPDLPPIDIVETARRMAFVLAAADSELAKRAPEPLRLSAPEPRPLDPDPSRECTGVLRSRAVSGFLNKSIATMPKMTKATATAIDQDTPSNIGRNPFAYWTPTKRKGVSDS